MARDDRTPPHNLEAEEAIIGAALLSQDAAAVLVGTLTPAAFYKAQHRHIAAAITAVSNAGTPVDVVTVADRLRVDGTLGDAGGMAAIHNFIANVPAISSAAHYADIVRKASDLRRILYLAGDIADTAYKSDDPGAAIVTVQRLIDELGTVGTTDIVDTLEVADIAALLETDLEAEEGTILERSDGKCLLYPGKMHMFQAEPTAGKSWIALTAVAEVLELGGAAIYLDFEDTPRGIIARLLNLGVDPALLAGSFQYVQPIGVFGPAERNHLAAMVDEMNPDLVIIDGVGEALARDGLSEDKATDVLYWFEKLPRWIARTGAAVVMIDHVVKDREQQGRYARGSGAKLSAIDGATYQLKVTKPFSRQKAGTVRMVVAKDRPGGVGAMAETAAVVSITPHGDGARVVVDLDPYTENRRAGDPWKPTHYMADVARHLDESVAPLTASALKALMSGHKKQLVEEAITRLVAEGYITKGSGRGAGYTLVKPYVDPEPIHEQPPPLTDDDAPPDYGDAALFDDPIPHPEEPS